LILLGAWWTWRWLRRQERNGTDLAAARFILLALVGAALLILPVRLLSFFGKGDFSGWAYQYLTTPAGHLWRTAFSTLVAAVVLVVFRRLWKQETLRPADIVAESTAVYIPLFVFWSIWTLLYFVGREVLHHLQGSFHLASNIDHLARFVLLWVPYLLVVRGCSLFEAIRDNFRFWIRSSGLPLVFAVTIFVAGLAPAGLYLLLRYMGASAFLPSEILGAAWASLNFVVEAAAVGLVCSLATEAEEAADEDIEEVESGLDF
jgi:hypothetical protein